MRLIRFRSLLLPLTLLILIMSACSAFGKQLRQVQSYPEWPDDIRNITATDDYVFVAMGQAGLYILDVSNPATPINIDFETPIDVVMWATIDGNYAYILGSYSLYIVDILDLSNPVVLGSYQPQTPIIKAVIQFPYIFLATGAGGLQVIDVSDPTTLEKVGVYDSTMTKLDIAVRNIAVSGEYAYITLNDSANYHYVDILNISNPTEPMKVGSIRVNLAGNIVSKGPCVFVTNGHGLQILDASVPSSPTIITSYDTLNFAQGLEVEGNHVYINDLFGVEVVDISDIHSPRRVAYSKLPQVQDIAVVDGYIYVADTTKGLVIFERP